MITISIIGNILHVVDGDRRYIVKPPIFSLRSIKGLGHRSIVVGFIGSRGSGKSVGGARLAIVDFFLAGISNVWSNMQINFRLNASGRVREFQSKPIDKLTLLDLDMVYQDGLIFQDEVNMLADSRRANTKGTLAFDYVVQQLRKRRLNLIWTAQTEDQVEMRLRNATDVFIKAVDLSLSNNKCDIGEFSRYRCYDYGGLVNEELPSKTFDGVFREAVVWNKPWWNSYSTWQIQGLEEERQISEQEQKMETSLNEIEKYIRQFTEPIDQYDVWAQWSIRDPDSKRQIRRELENRGIMSVDKSRKFVSEEIYRGRLS